MFEIGSDKWPGISKLIEECGEVLQICGKLMGAQGEVEHWDGTNLRDELYAEMGDLLAAIQFVTAYCDFDPRRIAQRADFKLALFEKWHREQTHPKRTTPPPLTTPAADPVSKLCTACRKELEAGRPLDPRGWSACYGCRQLNAPQPSAPREELPPCTGTLVHDEYTRCPRHDR